MLVRVQSTPDAPDSYLARQRVVAAQATGVDNAPILIGYTVEQDQTWADAIALVTPVWDRYAAAPVRSAAASLDLPRTAIPQVSLLSRPLEHLTGFGYASVPDAVSGAAFFGALAQRIFRSTPIIRWAGNPGYTPEPDVLHEIAGHANVLSHPKLAELHALAGPASVAAPGLLSDSAAVFWYSAEFGAVESPSRWKSYGAGPLSSPGELGWFAEHGQIRALDIDVMLSTPYDISRYQPVLFGAETVDHVVDTAGGYLTTLINRHT
jgi:phenylalanine-4-hydroxylase